jgi:hypothetical protein
MDGLVLALMTWISATSGLPMAEAPPDIVRVSPREMARLAHPRGVIDPEVESGYLALYHADSATILLRRDWDREDLRDRSLLVHELVHHLQAQAGRSYPCPGAREREAYEVQGAWLDRRGAELFDVLGMNALYYYAVTRC